MLESTTSIVDAVLPRDPEDGTVYSVPSGGTIGGSIVIHIELGASLIGTATQLVPIMNISRRYTLMRASVKKHVNKNDIINVSAEQYHYNKMIFLDYYGWVGNEASGKPHILDTGTYRVTHAIPIGKNTDGYYLYERLCLERIRIKE